jgi:3',5'-cyclic AMP phosphodiesterase CpdA
MNKTKFKILHISDLHFGREDKFAVTAGEIAIRELKPDLIVIAGDLTQRNWSWQFTNAQTFIQQFKVPYLIVPGNHDMPRFNLFRRFRSPLSHYIKYFEFKGIAKFENELTTIVGLNSIDKFQHKDGKLRSPDLQAALEVFKNKPNKSTWNILVSHHPLTSVRKVGDKALLAELLQHVDVWMSGHLHRFKFEQLQYQGLAYHGHQCISGTFISNRLRHEQNSFNFYEISADQSGVVNNYFLDRQLQQFIKTKQFEFQRAET